MKRAIILGMMVALLSSANPAFSGTAETQLAETETAFAKTMADRDLKAFASFIADEAVFFAGSEVLRGKAAVVAKWQPYYETPEPPFSWRPETVVVLESGDLGLSHGPVFNPEGKIVGYFHSTWGRESSGEWKVVFDKGEPPPPEAPSAQ